MLKEYLFYIFYNIFLLCIEYIFVHCSQHDFHEDILSTKPGVVNLDLSKGV